MNEKYYYIRTYGCQMNEHDTEKLALQLELCGYIATEVIEKADIIILNTCCVRESAEKKIHGKIGEIKHYKTANADLKLIIAGCMAQKDQEELLKKYRHIDLVLGTAQTSNLLSKVKEWQAEQERELLAKKVGETNEAVSTVHGKRKRKNKGQVMAEMTEADSDNSMRIADSDKSISAWVAIMKGCNNFCSYCIVPYVRGRERSRSESAIIEEIKGLAARGIKEVTLLGQNVNSYGKDLSDGSSFANLLSTIDTVEGLGEIKRVRYMTSHPRDMSDDVIEAIAKSSKVCEYFHLPLQSGCDRILKAMNRGYDTEYYRQLLIKIRKRFPHASFTTDLIIGFPGETEEMFEETLNFVKEMRFDAAFTFLYSKRSGTPAAEMAGQVSDADKKRRFKRLTDAQNVISLELNEAYLGKTVEILCEGESKNDGSMLMGRTRTNKIVMFPKSETDIENGGEYKEIVGTLLRVTVKKAQTWVLYGKQQ